MKKFWGWLVRHENELMLVNMALGAVALLLVALWKMPV